MISLFEKLAANSSVWSDEENNLMDFVKHFTLPTFAKVRKGQFSSVRSGKRFNDVIFIHSIFTSQCIVAESQFSGKNKSVFAIPLSYKGWFDILSEDKKHAKPITSANKLLNSNAELFLVRENTKLVLDSSNDHSRRSKGLEQGEILKLIEKRDLSRSSKNRQLFIFNDENDKTVHLESGQKFSLSPISTDNEIDGVHSIGNLLEHFCLPISVQLAYGEFFSSEKYHPILKLIGTCKIEFAIAISLKDTTQVLNIPLPELLTLSPLKDKETFRTTEEFKRVDKFANWVENHQRKMISLITSGNIIVSRKSFLKRNDEKLTPEDDGLYEDIDEIYRYVRAGGELSRFIADDAESSQPVCEMNTLEREIWDEPIYADISKFKTLKMAKKDKSKDSQLAIIGMENVSKEKAKEMKSSYKKSLQRLKSRNSSFTVFQELEMSHHENNWEPDHSSLMAPKRSISPSWNFTNSEISDNTQNHIDSETKEQENQFEFDSSQNVLSDQRRPSLSDDDVPQPKVVPEFTSDDEIMENASKGTESFESSETEGKDSAIFPAIAASRIEEESALEEEHSSEDTMNLNNSLQTESNSVQSLNDSVEHLPNLRDKTEEGSSGHALLNSYNLQPKTEVQNYVREENPSTLNHQTENIGDIVTYASFSRAGGTVPKNVSRIKLGSSNTFALDETTEEECSDVDFGGTFSSKTLLKAGMSSVIFNHQYPSSSGSDNSAPVSVSNDDDDFASDEYSNITTIKITKKGFVHQDGTLSGVKRQQHSILKSPFGSTQIYIRRAVPSRGDFSSKFSADRSFS